MDIQEQAQRFAEILLTSGLKGEWDIPTNNTYEAVASDAWRMADAMQEEADKRKQQKLEEVRKGLKEGWFTEKEGEHFEEVSEALRQTLVSDEWQPDWSVAPDDATLWRMHANGLCSWGCVAESIGYSFQVPHSEAPNFGYVGSWIDSLRKRP